MQITWPPGLGGAIAIIALILIVVFWSIGKLLTLPMLAIILLLIAISRLC